MYDVVCGVRALVLEMYGTERRKERNEKRILRCFREKRKRQ